jgi:hypothetical protein
MKNSRQPIHFTSAVALAAALATSGIVGSAIAEQDATVSTDRGFKPDTGQINPGVEEQAPTQSTEIADIPTPEESRAALMMPISTQPSAGTIPTELRPELPSATAPKTTQSRMRQKRNANRRTLPAARKASRRAGARPFPPGRQVRHQHW